jgi:hypothetical protein
MLTKSDLQTLLQCPRRLWLDHYQPEQIPRDDATLYRRAMDGDIVGRLQERLRLRSKMILPLGRDDRTAVAKEAEELLAKSPAGRAAEVPTVNAGLYARADALVPDGGHRCD